MIQFVRDMPESPFLLTGLLAGLLASITCGVIGPFVIARRIVFLSGAIAHMALGGVGAALFLRPMFHDSLCRLYMVDDVAAVFVESPLLGGLSRLIPTIGAAIAALLGAVVIGLVEHRARERSDTLIGAMWAIGMSVGILFIKFTPGYHTELMSYLFGNITFVTWDDVVLMTGLSIIVAAVALVCHKRLLALCLDEEQAALQGVNVPAMNMLLLCLVALAVICLIRVVGLILVLALLTLPAATAGHHVRRLAAMSWLAIGLGALIATLPRIAVYGTRVSPESAIVLAAGAIYLLSVLLRRRQTGELGPSS